MRKLNWTDIALIKLAVFFFAFAFMYWVPQVHDYGWKVWLALAIIFGVWPGYKFWIKK